MGDGDSLAVSSGVGEGSAEDGVDTDGDMVSVADSLPDPQAAMSTTSGATNAT